MSLIICEYSMPFRLSWTTAVSLKSANVYYSPSSVYLEVIILVTALNEHILLLIWLLHFLGSDSIFCCLDRTALEQRTGNRTCFGEIVVYMQFFIVMCHWRLSNIIQYAAWSTEWFQRLHCFSYRCSRSLQDTELTTLQLRSLANINSFYQKILEQLCKRIFAGCVKS